MKDKLVYVKTKTKTKNNTGELDCDECSFDDSCASTGTHGCEEGYNYQLVTEEQEIQTEWEWRKKRYDLLLENRDITAECANHAIWLEENKPSDWQPCTRENTEVGDTVRMINCHNIIRKIEYVYKKHDQFIVSSNNGEYPHAVELYEINTLKGDE